MDKRPLNAARGEVEPRHPRLEAIVEAARKRAASSVPALALVYPCDEIALEAAQRILSAGIARPVLVGPKDAILKASDAAGLDPHKFEIVSTGPLAAESARTAVSLARQGVVSSLMKGSLHTDELMAPVVAKDWGLRGNRRISHAFLFDLPRYHKLIALADCVVNISPNLATKRDILLNAVELFHRLGYEKPKVGVVAAVETVNPQIPATLDAKALVELSAGENWRATVEGPLGFDNAFSAKAANVKKIASQVAGDADLLVVPDLNSGNMLYKSFVYVAGGDCAGLVLGAKVPIVLTSRADSLESRLASVALAVLTAGDV